MTNAPGPYAAETLGRVRAWTVSSWRHRDRVAGAKRALRALAELAGRADGRDRPAVPDAGVHALSDQLVVLTADALSSGATAEAVDGVLRELGVQLGPRIA